MEASSMPVRDSGTVDYLVELWTDLLHHPRIGIDDDFFEAGGSSMQVIEMLMTVSDRFGKDVDYSEFFSAPCINRLAAMLDS